MVEARTNRRLAAILAADVVGYSRLMANDEISTLEALKRHREVVFDPEVSAHGGRIFKLMGDGTLVEFASVVDAVKCAVAIQTMPVADDIKLRIGINLGDVIIEGDDIYGDGVNIATRLETFAEPGGICVTSIVNESIGKRIDISFEDGGEVLVKNIDRPIRVWKWHRDVERTRQIDQGSTASPAAASTNRSIAVLPFTNMSGNPEEEYFCDGMTEDIITDLSKIPKLVVIARNSSFAYKGKSIDIRTIGRELGVRSVLEGSVRRAADRVRVNAQLIDAESGAHIWAERYDRAITDIFTLQDDLTQQIVDALKITLNPDESRSLNANQQKNVIAHDLLLRARALIIAGISTRDKFEEAQLLLRQALESDPGCAEAYALLSTLHAIDHQNHYSPQYEQAVAHALELAEQAIAADADEPLARYSAAVAHLLGGNLAKALEATDVALALNPNFALALECKGVVHLLSDEPIEAVSYLERAMRLDPAGAQQCIHFLGMAYLIAEKYTTAAAYFRERILLVPESDFSRAYLAAALVQIGEVEEARQVWNELKKINPDYDFDEHIERWPFKDTVVRRIRQGLETANLL